MKNTFWVSILIIVLLGTGLWLFNETHKGNTVRITVAQAEKDIQDHLPIGSTRASVASYLDQRGLAHSYIGESKEFPEENRTERAIIRDSSHTWLIRGDIQLVFYFDDGQRMTKFTAKEIFTGP